MSAVKPSVMPCIQIITPRSSPMLWNYPSKLSTCEFDPAVYREELLRKLYLSTFPMDSKDRPDYLIKLGHSKRSCSTITLEFKGRDDKRCTSRLPRSFVISSFLITILFIIMLYVYIASFVTFF